ncbi:MAG: NUDIX domain-containing protein [Spirochaetota bacterium]
MQDNPFNFCPGCGLRAPRWSDAKKVDCPRCGFTLYMNVASATACLITRRNELLLTVRERDPGKGLFGLPGGFVDPGEGAVAGLARELFEELGLTVAEERLVFLFSFPNRYPYKGIVYDTCDLFFQLELSDSEGEPRAGDEVSSLLWRRADSVRPEEMAFDSMGRAVKRFASNRWERMGVR